MTDGRIIISMDGDKQAAENLVKEIYAKEYSIYHFDSAPSELVIAKAGNEVIGTIGLTKCKNGNLLDAERFLGGWDNIPEAVAACDRNKLSEAGRMAVREDHRDGLVAAALIIGAFRYSYRNKYQFVYTIIKPHLKVWIKRYLKIPMIESDRPIDLSIVPEDYRGYFRSPPMPGVVVFPIGEQSNEQIQKIIASELFSKTIKMDA